MFEIRHATINDIPAIRDLVFKVWPQTYAGILPQDKIDYMLDLMYSEASLKKQIEGGSQFILIDNDSEAVGYAAYQGTGAGIFKLHKLYVLPSQQGKGTGRHMVDYIIDQIKKQGAKLLELQVNRANKARYFYEKIGFAIRESIDLDIGNGYIMDDYIMEKKV
jgi:N-acetylglutamate synthase-like GNAT family acetyltransferase